jgi:2-dehydro-3-deoxyphosphooctonate aldolase (KDO 8-P synthase)
LKTDPEPSSKDRILSFMGTFSLPVVQIGSVSMDGTEPVLILDPCVIESEDFIWSVAEKLGTLVQQHG